MERLVIMTVGKTHSGKSTFATKLEKQLENAVVVDQDRHAEFINTYYSKLLAKEGPNTIKYAVTKTIVDHAIEETGCHLIICNSNRSRSGRQDLLDYFHNKGFTSILVNFDLPDRVLKERIAASSRSKKIFRSAATFEEVLARQNAESDKNGVTSPVEGEADYLFVIRDTNDVSGVIQEIGRISSSKRGGDL
ncbi:ATP-binding protein [Bacillus sp. Marseille-Q1617]|uniref:ATP-binding protein n=1 Tax=Bacillus sp. Marseille-Q1617 TaxID=2736887 RepID=UPI00158A0381|nr:ATP-binding protein [Bacillus sp. Marseille-Q1617]